MNKYTERELTRTGIAEGAAVTPEIMDKLRKMLMERDAQVAGYAETVLLRKDQIEAVARLFCEDGEVLPRPDDLPAKIKKLQEQLVWTEYFLRSEKDWEALRRIVAKELGGETEKAVNEVNRITSERIQAQQAEVENPKG